MKLAKDCDFNLNENNKKNKIKLITTIIVTAILILTIIIITNNKKTEPNKSFSITYTSVKEEKSVTYVNFNIETNYSVHIKSTDFSVLINEVPLTANGIVKGISSTMTPSGLTSAYIVGTEITISENKQILVNFDFTLNELDKPLTFLYQGQILELGKPLKLTQ